MRYAWFALAVVALLLSLAGALYKAGPAQKQVERTTTVDDYCNNVRDDVDVLRPEEICLSDTRGSEVTYQVRVRTSAWERVSGALTG